MFSLLVSIASGAALRNTAANNFDTQNLEKSALTVPTMQEAMMIAASMSYEAVEPEHRSHIDTVAQIANLYAEKNEKDLAVSLGHVPTAGDFSKHGHVLSASLRRLVEADHSATLSKGDEGVIVEGVEKIMDGEKTDRRATKDIYRMPPVLVNSGSPAHQ